MTDAVAAALAWQAAVDRRYRAARPRSEALALRARGLMAGGETRVGSSVPPFGPVFAEARGQELTDVDGNVVLDNTNNATSLIHGHANPAIVAAASAAVGRGTQWLGLNPSIVELADLIVDRVPSVERVRFTNSGSEANGLMVKVARAFTGRDLILKMDAQYHGSNDTFEFGPTAAPGADRSRPSPVMDGVARNLAENVLIGRFNDTDGVVDLIERNAGRLAAVLLAPVASVGYVEPAPGFLEGVREATRRHGILLLFDEVITLRLARGGAQERYGVVPDMTSMAKIIGGGFPVGAYGGREEILRLTDATDGAQRVTHAGTFNGNPVTAAAGRVSLELLTPEAFARLERVGEALERTVGGAIAATGAPFKVSRAGSLLYMDFQPPRGDGWDEAAEIVHRRLATSWLAHGVLGSAINASTVMTDSQVEEVGRRFRAAMGELMGFLGDALAAAQREPAVAGAAGS
jgi:glutamate-1-semialdehyde 2,1-aminomutase